MRNWFDYFPIKFDKFIQSPRFLQPSSSRFKFIIPLICFLTSIPSARRPSSSSVNRLTDRRFFLKVMRRRMMHQDPQSRIYYELSSLVLSLLRSPSLSSRHRFPAEITPAGFASLMLGISLSMMLCGSVTFLIGFMLMPWVIGLVMVLYVVGVVSSLSMLGRAVLCHITAIASSPRKDIPDLKLL